MNGIAHFSKTVERLAETGIQLVFIGERCLEALGLGSAGSVGNREVKFAFQEIPVVTGLHIDFRQCCGNRLFHLRRCELEVRSRQPDLFVVLLRQFQNLLQIEVLGETSLEQKYQNHQR